MATFKSNCPHCQCKLELDSDWAGMEVECPECSKIFTVTAPAAERPKIVPKMSAPARPVPGFAPSAPPVQNSALPPGGFKVNNVLNNPNMKLLESSGCFSVYEHKKDLSNTPDTAEVSYFMEKMNVRKRQVLCQLQGNTIKMQAGSLQWSCGTISSETGLGSGARAVGGFLKNMVKGFVTGESAVKPLYSGYGFVMLEPTYKYILIENIADWGPAGVVLQDGLFLACDAHLQEKVVSRKSLSSLIAGEGLFNLMLAGNGVAVFESPVPREELIEIELNGSELKIDGNMAIAWSNTLQLTVERSSKSLIGSMVNGEGLVNVYRGTGKVWMTPTVDGTLMDDGEAPDDDDDDGGSLIGDIIDAVTD